MAVERDLELLDDYLAGRLNGEDKTAFERQMEADPELKNELQLQQTLIEGIKKARVAELKSILSNTPIPPIHGGETAVFTKAAAWVIVAGLVGTGLYFYFSDEEKQQPIKTPITQEKKNEIPAEVPAIKEAEEISAITKETTTINKEEKKVSKPTTKKEKAAAAEASSKVDQPKLEVYDPTQELENTDAPKADPKLDVSAKALVHSSITLEVNATSKKYTFHYQFKDGKLLLYGPFEKNLYEIMEFFANDKRTMFLFYKNNYYLLNEDSNKIKPLASINDPVLLKKLREYRGN